LWYWKPKSKAFKKTVERPKPKAWELKGFEVKVPKPTQNWQEVKKRERVLMVSMCVR
jgi:hypothetical protein